MPIWNGESAEWPNRKRRTDGARGCTGRRSYASFHLAPDPKISNCPAFCFACFVLPFFTLFAQLQIEIPLLSRGRIKRRTIRCNGHRFRIIPRPVFVSHPRKIFFVDRCSLRSSPFPRIYDILFPFSGLRSSGRKEIEPRSLLSALSLSRITA